jgi:CO/xanthine dehydrogenase FAD-binding subunit
LENCPRGEKMIAFDFEYYKPNSIDEAVNIFKELSSKNKQSIYYSGGTEIITFARNNDIYTDAVIDIKGIPECNILELKGNEFSIGAAVSLTQLSEANIIPLISRISSYPADHTARNKITIGGNICGKIMYKEAVLGPLITDSSVVIAGKSGIRILSINHVFDQKLQLEKGEFLVQIRTQKKIVSKPYITIRRTKQEKASYPLITLAALKIDNHINIAFSGVCAFPFRSPKVEEAINNMNISMEQRVNEAINNLPAPISDNVQGSGEYRKFVLKNALLDTIAILEGE